MKNVLISVLAMSAMVVSANAACSATGCYNVKITKLAPLSNGNVQLETDGTESLANCGAGRYFTLIKTDIGQKEMYSLLLTAYTTGQSVSIRSVDGTSQCNIAYVFIQK